MTGATRQVVQSTLLEQPFRPYRSGTPVNPAGKWRMRCPDGHTCLSWWGPTTVACRSCDECFTPSRISDVVSGLSLGELVDADGGQR